jgi:hypothetical protein
MPMRASAAHTVVMAAVAVALVAPLKATAQNRAPRTSVSRAADAPPGLAAIREADLRRDMEALAGDAMRGREAGTLDELRASAWLAERARAAGLEPAGEDGTYFQFWPTRLLQRTRPQQKRPSARTLAVRHRITMQRSKRRSRESSVDAPACLVHRRIPGPAQIPAESQSFWAT